MKFRQECQNFGHHKTTPNFTAFTKFAIICVGKAIFCTNAGGEP